MILTQKKKRDVIEIKTKWCHVEKQGRLHGFKNYVIPLGRRLPLRISQKSCIYL